MWHIHKKYAALDRNNIIRSLDLVTQSFMPQIIMPNTMVYVAQNWDKNLLKQPHYTYLFTCDKFITTRAMNCEKVYF